MSKEGVKTTLGNVLLAFQVCLALWQILKLTPLGAVVQGVTGWLLRPLCLSPTYTGLHSLPGRVFKKVDFFWVLEKSFYPPRRKRCDGDEIRFVYLGADFHLERRGTGTGTDKNMLFVNGKMCYYITQGIWNELASTAAELALPEVQRVVFLKNYKEIWEHVATGRYMTFEEVLDSLVLENQTRRRLGGSSWLLPVDLSVSEEKLLKVLNLAGLFLQTKKVYWLIPVLLSFISTVMEFCTPLRIWIYGKVNLFCHAMHLICDRLPRSMRMQTYALGKMVENLKPSNDIKLKVTRGDITAIIAAGAKVHTEGALTLVPLFVLEDAATEKTLHCQPIDCDPIDIECRFNASTRSCIIRATTFDEISVGCLSRSHFLSILTLVSSIAKNGCGSLKSYGTHQNVRVRGLMHSIYSHQDAGYPIVYEMKLENVKKCKRRRSIG
jgi:hypothetical protein